MALTSRTIVAMLALVGGLAACGSSDEGADSAPAMDGRLIAPECGGGYDLEDAQVTLRNESDEIIGTATTTSNRVAPLTAPCVVDFSISEVPKAKFYTIKIGTHAGPAWSAKELASQDFDPELTLDDAEVTIVNNADFCSAMAEVEDIFDNVDLLNDDPDAWTDRLQSYKADIHGYAAGILLNEPDSEVALKAITAGDALDGVDGWERAKALNADLEPFNDAISDPFKEAGCGYWMPTTYS